MGCIAEHGTDPDRAAYGGGRMSAARRAIARAVDAQSGRAFSVEDVAGCVRAASPGIGLATVYRAITAMEAAGSVEQVGSRDGATLYARCGSTRHHHHLLCTGCGAVADVECPVHVDVHTAEGFAVTGHSLVIYGLCAACCGKAASDAHA